MARTSTYIAVAMALAALTAPVAGALAAEPTGVWTAAEGKSRVKISKCGANLCGSVVWLREPNDETGKPKLDIHNADAGARGRPIIGTGQHGQRECRQHTPPTTNLHHRLQVIRNTEHCDVIRLSDRENVHSFTVQMV